MRAISPGAIDVIHHAMQIGSLVLFALFVTLGLRAAMAPLSRRRRAINHFLLYTIGVHAILIVVQKDAWPFSVYPMMALVDRDQASSHVMIDARAVDSAGHEWPVDSSAWSPLYPPSTLAWFDLGYLNASPAERRDVMRFLLDRAEKAREQSAAGAHSFGNRVILGPFAASDTNLYEKARPSPLPFRGLRIYRVLWNPRAFAADPTRVTRKLVCEYHS